MRIEFFFKSVYFLIFLNDDTVFHFDDSHVLLIDTETFLFEKIDFVGKIANVVVRLFDATINKINHFVDVVQFKFIKWVYLDASQL